MKNPRIAALIGLLASIPAQGDTITQWTFDSQPPDAATATGTLQPGVGQGFAQTLGGVTTAFSSGQSASGDDSGWQTTSYPPSTNYNKTGGVQFSVDTTGYTNLVLSWWERHSGSASRYTRLRYSLNSYHFYDADVFVTSRDSVFLERTVSLAAIPGSANNPFFTFQVVSEFESTATGAGTNAYVATRDGSSYSWTGTIRFDSVTVSGTLLPGANSPPHISPLPNLILRVGQRSDSMAFEVWDLEDPGSSLVVSASCSDPALVSQPGLELAGDTGHRILTVTAGTQPGVATVALRVFDTGGKDSVTSFTLTVLPANTAPIIGLPCARTNTLSDIASPPVPFTVSDLESAPENLQVWVTSANPALVAPGSVAIQGAGANRSLTVQPEPGQAGVAPLRLHVSDGTNVACADLCLLVVPATEHLFCDGFDYENGSLVTNSAGAWVNRSGTHGEMEVLNGQILVTGEQSEDVGAVLIGAPHQATDGIVLYAAFELTALGLPRALPEYLAHFGEGTTYRARIFAGTTNAAPGRFRLGIANSTEPPVGLPLDLQTNQAYRVVLRYDLDAARSKLWVEPGSEADAGVTSSPTPTPNRISYFAFRQATTLGTAFLVDNLRVGRTFQSVVPGAGPIRPRLRSHREGLDLVLAWDDLSFELERADSVEGPYEIVPGASSPFQTNAVAGPLFFRLRK